MRKRQAQDERGDAAGTEGKAVKPELTKAARNYLDLHRYAAVKASLLAEQGIALRLMVAHAIAGSPLWRVGADPCRAEKPESEASLTASKAAAVMSEEEQAVRTLLGLEDDQSVMGWRYGDARAVFATLTGLDDAEVMKVLTYLMAQSLSVGTALIDDLGAMLGTDMASWWEADDAFLGLIRDRATLLPMLEDIGGKTAAEAHKASPAKVIRSVIRQYASGEGREKAQGWVPPYLAFPAKTYADPTSKAA